MFKLFFATPDKKILDDVELDEITLPAYSGELNILPGHSPMMTTLMGGIVRVKLKSGENYKTAIAWGYCQVSKDGVTVLAETAHHAADIDVKMIERHLATQEGLLLTETLDDHHWNKINRDISRLRAELQLAAEKN